MGKNRQIISAEVVRSVLAWMVAACAAGIMIAGFFAKSTRWTDLSSGQSIAWIDGIKPWAVWSVLGGGVVLLLLFCNLWADRWIPLSAASMLIFWRVATLADSYRTRLESADWVSTYDHQQIAFGLRAVPVVGIIGLLTAAFLIAVATWRQAQDRRAVRGPAPI